MTRKISKHWTQWPADEGLGFSFEDGNLVGQMSPYRKTEGSMTLWHGKIMDTSKNRIVARVTSDNHWDCADDTESEARAAS